MDIRVTGPCSLEARSRRSYEVIHLPARPTPIILVGPADCLYDLAFQREAKITQTVQRLKRAMRPLIVMSNAPRIYLYRFSSGSGSRRVVQRLLIPCLI